MIKVAVILAGCGFLDGAEIRESVLSLLALEQCNLAYQIFAPDRPQYHVVNHLDKQPINQERNILEEAARIARGEITPLTELNVEQFDALLLPGGFGVAKNFCNVALKGSDAEIDREIGRVIMHFNSLNKKIGAICISPALVALAFKNIKAITVTLGDDTRDNRGLIEKLGSFFHPTKDGDIYIDESNNIASGAAYMRNSSLPKIYQEIKKVVEYLAQA